MNSYSIDASVYAFPFNSKTGDAKEIKNYCKTIRLISRLVRKKGKLEPRHIKYFFFNRDIELICNNKSLQFPKSTINQMQKILKNNNIMHIGVRDAQKMFQYLIDELNTKNTLKISNIQSSKFYEKWQKGIFFEKWFNIEDVDFKNNKYPLLPDGINEINTKKNISKIAYLNKYVYKNDEIHKIIFNGCMATQPISMNGAVLDITMTKGFYTNNKITYKYIIKNAPLKNVPLGNQKVNISTLDALKSNYKYRSWEEALTDAQKQFKNHLEFGLDVKVGLEEYINKIKKESENMHGNDRQIINDWMKEGPTTLYENLRAINNFVSKADLSKAPPQNRNDFYYCHKNCEFYMECCSNLRFFGIDCSYESNKAMNNAFVIADREKMNNKNVKEKYWIHLKPKIVFCDDPFLWFLSLRIHFRYLGNRKIGIGWIGRHLYLPCPKRNKISDCIRLECPLNPNSKDHDPKADELTNYLKQWPKTETEPENEPLKTEKPE